MRACDYLVAFPLCLGALGGVRLLCDGAMMVWWCHVYIYLTPPPSTPPKHTHTDLFYKYGRIRDIDIKRPSRYV